MSQPEMKINVNADFKYLWLKYVTGANIGQHSERGLTGSYSNARKNQQGEQTIILDEHQSKAIYLCGVSTPYRWEKNFFLAMLPSPGDIIEHESNGIRVAITNAKRILFEEYDAFNLSSNQNRERKEYYACRNWIFANYAIVNGILQETTTNNQYGCHVIKHHA